MDSQLPTQSPTVLPSNSPIVRKGISNNVIIVLLLILIIVLTLGGIFYLDQVKNNNIVNSVTNVTITGNPERTKTLDELANSTEYADATSKIIVDDTLAEQFKKDPNFGITKELVDTKMAKIIPDYSQMSIDEIKLAFKKYITDLSTQNVGAIKTIGMQAATADILAEEFYLANIAGSSYVSAQSRPTWIEAINTGKTFLYSLSNQAINQKAELKLYLDNFFAQSEFVNLK